jgi:hypothetical protein
MHRLYYSRNFPDLPLIVMVAEAGQDIYAARASTHAGNRLTDGRFCLGFV